MTNNIFIANAERTVIGSLPDNVYLDIDEGKENTYKLEISYSDYDPELHENGNFWFFDNSNIGGVLNHKEIDSKTGKISFEGDTFRGLLNKMILEPPYGKDYYILRSQTLSSAIVEFLKPRLMDKYATDSHRMMEITEKNTNKNLLNPHDCSSVTSDYGAKVLAPSDIQIRLQTYTQEGGDPHTTGGSYIIDIGKNLNPGYNYWFSFDSITKSTHLTSVIIRIMKQKTLDSTPETHAILYNSASPSVKQKSFPIDPNTIYTVQVDCTWADGDGNRGFYVAMYSPMLEYYTNSSPSSYVYHQKHSVTKGNPGDNILNVYDMTTKNYYADINNRDDITYALSGTDGTLTVTGALKFECDYFLDFGQSFSPGTYKVQLTDITSTRMGTMYAKIVRMHNDTLDEWTEIIKKDKTKYSQFLARWSEVKVLYDNTGSSTITGYSFDLKIDPHYTYMIQAKAITTYNNWTMSFNGLQVRPYKQKLNGEPFFDGIQFSRYCSLLDAINKMCNGQDYKFMTTATRYSGHSAGEKFFLDCSCVPVVRISDETEIDEDSEFTFKIEKNNQDYTHVLALGSGELSERLVVKYEIRPDLSLMEIVNFPKDRDFKKAKIYVYDYSSAKNKGTLKTYAEKKIKEIMGQKDQQITVNEEMNYDIGDIATATNKTTGTTVEQPITEKIIKVSNGTVKISYKIGDET